MRYLLLLLFGASIALAQPAPGPAFPTPPATPPGAGAPTLGQPGRLEPGIRPEPNPRPTRVLPPEKGPGIWAVDAPDGHVFRLTVLDIEFTMAVEREGDLGQDVAKTCAAMLDAQASGTTHLRSAAMRLTTKERRCLVAQMFQTCVKTYAEMYRDGDKGGEPELRALGIAMWGATTITKHVCDGGAATAEVGRIADMWAQARTSKPGALH